MTSIRYRDNIGDHPDSGNDLFMIVFLNNKASSLDNQYGENYNIGNKQYSSKNLSYCPMHRFLESVTLLTAKAIPRSQNKISGTARTTSPTSAIFRKKVPFNFQEATPGM